LEKTVAPYFSIFQSGTRQAGQGLAYCLALSHLEALELAESLTLKTKPQWVVSSKPELSGKIDLTPWRIPRLEGQSFILVTMAKRF
jgi:hypothetical protein